MAAPTVVLTIVKDMPYRGVAGEEWSNTYMLTGATPSDSSAWRALFDAVVAEEKKVYAAPSRTTRGYGYDKVPAKGDHAIWSVDLRPTSTTVVGTASTGTGQLMSGDQAGWVRWSLDRFNPKGKRVYLRKYFHMGMVAIASPPDAILTGQRTLYDAFGTFMMGGTLLGSRRICDRLGNVPIASTSSTWVTTRTLKKRSKRPPA